MMLRGKLMSAVVVSGPVQGNATVRRKRLGEGALWYDWSVLFSRLWMLTGAGLDGYAHFHGLVDKTIFTPYHAMMYSGFFFVLLVHMGVASINRARGYSLFEAVPAGYAAS